VKAGAAQVEITPPLGLPMDGYGPRTSSGVHDPLLARVLVAEGGDGTGVALVVADLLHVDTRLQASIAAGILAATGIPREQMQLVGTHTHSGPAFPKPTPVEQTMGDAIAGAASQAWASRREAAVSVGIDTVVGIGANRRPKGGPVDDRVTVARFDAVDGTPIATLMNYGCHPTTLGPNNSLYSADYPGVACRLVAAEIGGVAMFTTGPQGDVNPGGYSPEGSMVGVVVPWRTFESAERYGSLVAAAALEAYGRLRPEPADDVWAVARELRLARRPLPDARLARTTADAAMKAAAAIREAEMSEDAVYHSAVGAAYADLLAGQAADPERDGPVRLRVSALGFGPFTHVGVQGELFVALGQQIRAQLDPDTTCVAALCDGTVGYIPTAESFADGGYEPNASVLRPGEGERLVDEVVAMVRERRSGSAAMAGQHVGGA
jgi:hypothetical protein